MINRLMAVFTCATIVYAIYQEVVEHGSITVLSFLEVLALICIAIYSYTIIIQKSDILEISEDRVLDAIKKSTETSRVLNELIENLPCAVTVVSPNYQLLRINKEVTKLTAVSQEDSNGKKCYDVFGTGQICENCPVQKTLKSKEIHRNVKREITRLDKEIYIEQTAIPIFKEDGRLKYVFEIILDVTEKVQSEKETKQLFTQMIGAFSTLIDKRDSATGKHSLAVMEIAIGIGKQLGLSSQLMEEISIAALLHDVGKIGIPEILLNKPDQLTNEEYFLIQQHSRIGYDAIKNIKQLENIAEYILHHHEKFDGTGYPAKIKGEEIPLVSRILSIADVFEAITADRVYRPAIPLEQALVVMYSGKGNFFDPVLLNAFFNYLIIENKDVESILAKVIDRLSSGAKTLQSQSNSTFHQNIKQ